MSKLVLVSASDLEGYLFSLGYVKLRIKGSHRFYRHSDGRYTTIPFHSNNKLLRPLIRSILRQIQVTIEDYNSYFK
ncbi:MAG: type II toxin-antitoxin system HicA family toxin [Saprospiraceae bacterium]